MSETRPKRRKFTYEADAELLTDHLRRARAGSEHSGYFHIFSDEGPAAGGDGSAPTPLAYLVAALGL